MTVPGPAGFHVGRLLVATPVIGDPNFDRTVVLLLHHDDEGAFGVVLNRPTDIDLGDLLPEWAGLAAAPAVAFVGGPVEGDRAIALARAAVGLDGFSPVLGQVGTLDLARDADAVADSIVEMRVFAGYAGWSPGQLEGEIDGGAWFVLDAHADDALCADPDDLWVTVLRRQGGDLALYAAMPLDPSLN